MKAMDLDGLMRHARPEREYAIFRQRAAYFIKTWAPTDLRDRDEFTADLMGMFRELQLSQSEVFTSVLTRIYAMTPAATFMPTPVNPEKDESKP